MDSREMYNAARHLSSTMTWDKEWIHFGTENQVKYDLINKLIKNHLNTQELLLVNERTNSGRCERDEIIGMIKPILGKENFQLWTKSMDRVIEFNKIGVLHLGQKTEKDQRAI